MIIAIIQARMNSSRLRGKVLIPLVDKPVIEHIINRVKLSKYINDIVVATTTSLDDEPLAAYLKNKLKCNVYRGAEDDVLDRFYNCALKYHADLIVRVTADDPLKDPKIIDVAIKQMLDEPALDYCSNTINPTFPEGLDVEVFKSSALKTAFENAKLNSEREHVTPYIWKNPGVFKIKNFSQSKNISAWRWTLDTPDDLVFIKTIYEKFYRGNSYFSYELIIEYIKNNPQLLLINNKTARNEGYIKSVKKEQR